MAGSHITPQELLQRLKDLDGSDLHLRVGCPPEVRVHGLLRPLEGYPNLSAEDTEKLALSVISDEQRRLFESRLELDFSFGVEGLSRYRVNIFRQKNTVGAVMRVIPWRVNTFEELGLPNVVSDLCRKPRGLVLITGPTGSGKTTTLAAMIDKINSTRQQHIITIEDPIEFVHTHKKCVVTQRELGADTHSFADSLRSALRQDPDIVLVGEMRDIETIEMALRVAETGHLTLATLHTNTAASTINRIVDVFPATQQAQIRTQLSLVLEGIMCQALLPNVAGNGRVMALEILIPTSAVRNLIREEKIHQIYSIMQTSGETYGMQTLNQSLASLYHRRMITMETALTISSNPDELRELCSRKQSAPAGSGSMLERLKNPVRERTAATGGPGRA